MECPKCGREIADSARFCSVCGTPNQAFVPKAAPEPAPRKRSPLPAIQIGRASCRERV